LKQPFDVRATPTNVRTFAEVLRTTNDRRYVDIMKP
jgi:hypothetical protein